MTDDRHTTEDRHMTTIPLFTPWQMNQLQPLYSVLRALPPDEAYALMHGVHAAERRAVLGTFHADAVAHVRPRLELAPLLAERYDLDDLARQFGDYLLELNFDSTFLMMLLGLPDKLAHVVDMGNVEVLDDAMASGRPVILAPLHTGPVYASLGVLALRYPVTALYHHIPLDELRDTWLPGGDLQGIQVPGADTLLRCREALGARRLLTIFPEFDPKGAGPLHVPLSFLGTTVAATSGLAMIAQRAEALIVPCAFARTGPARYGFRFESAIEPGKGTADRIEVTESLFRFAEEMLLAGEPGKWEVWWDFDRLADGAWLEAQQRAAA